MNKIGILGGTFDPVHIEHIRLAKSAVQELGLDKLLVMPTFIPPHKSLMPSPAEDRLNMLKLAFYGEEKIEVCDFEIKKQGKSFTYQTVEYFKAQTGAEIYFIVGGDMLTDFKTWRFPERILNVATLAVFNREDFEPDFTAEQKYFNDTFNKSFVKLSYVGKNYSSTKLRVYSWFNLPLTDLTDQKVVDYIKEKELYKGDKYTEYISKNLPLKRVKHTADVVITALKKVKRLGLDYDKVKLATTLHDCAKYLDYHSVSGFTLPEGVPAPVEHAFLGAHVAKTVLGVQDQEVLDAIAYHTSGKPNMSLLGKLVFVADMVEEGRNYEGVEKLRELYEGDDFEKCFVECLKEEFIHLVNKKQYIYQETINAFAFYTEKQ